MPAEMTPVLLMEAMHWSYAELMATPPHIVDDAVTLLQKRAAIAREQEAARAAENRRGQR